MARGSDVLRWPPVRVRSLAPSMSPSQAPSVLHSLDAVWPLSITHGGPLLKAPECGGRLQRKRAHARAKPGIPVMLTSHTIDDHCIRTRLLCTRSYGRRAGFWLGDGLDYRAV
jgi:hypothetical protein